MGGCEDVETTVMAAMTDTSRVRTWRQVCRRGYGILALAGIVQTCVLAWQVPTLVQHALVPGLAALLLLPNLANRQWSVVQSIIGLYIICLALGDLSDCPWAVRLQDRRLMVSQFVLPIGTWLLGAVLYWSSGDVEWLPTGLVVGWAVAVGALALQAAALAVLLDNIYGQGFGHSHETVIASLVLLLPVALLWPVLQWRAWRRGAGIILIVYYGARFFIGH